MTRSKIATYLGFARRAGKLTLGVQAAATLKKGVFVLVADESAAKNSRKEMDKLQKRFSCPLIFVKGLDEMTGKANCKLAAVKDGHLAEAIVAVSAAEQPSGGGEMEETWHTKTLKN